MLEICVIPDTAQLTASEAHKQFDPLAIEFGTPETTKSLIRMIAWKCENEFLDNSNWLDDVWKVLDWPPSNQDGEIYPHDEGEITSISIMREMSQLADRQQIIDFATEAKALFLSTLNV